MTKSLMIFIIAIILATECYAGNLEITPSQPGRGGEISLLYKADNRFSSIAKLSAFVYIYSENGTIPTASEVRLLRRSGNEYTGSITVPDNAVYGLVKISETLDELDLVNILKLNDDKESFKLNNIVYDDNAENLWDFLVFNGNNPVISANLKAALANMGGSPAGFSKRVNFALALNYLKKEVELYPENIQAKIGLASLQFDLKRISKDQFDTELQELVKGEPNNNEGDIRAIARALRAINKADKADEIEEDFAKRHPNSELAEEVFVNSLSKANNLEEFSQGVYEYMKLFPKSQNRTKIFSAVTTAFLESNELEELLKFLDKCGDVPTGVYTQIAFAIQDKDDLTEDLDDIQKAEKALAIMDLAMYEGAKFSDIRKPLFMTSTEWKVDRIRNYGSLLEQYSQLLITTNKLEKALIALIQSAALLGDQAPSNLYDNLIDVASDLNAPEKAYQVINDAILNSNSNEDMEKSYKDICTQLKLTGDYDKKLDSLKSFAKKERITSLSYHKLNADVDSWEVKSSDGKSITLSELKGKTVIIGFWANWCGPCKVSSKAMEKLFLRYKEHKDIAFLAINVWENSKVRKTDMEKYIKEQDLSLPVYYDEKDELPYKIGFTGLPTIVFIDKNGKLQFIETGIQTEEDFIQGVQDKIEILSNE